MPSRITSRSLALLFLIIAVGAVLSGCTTAGTTFRSDMTWQRFGIRPDEPAPADLAKLTSCEEYDQYVAYGQRLKEAYQSRATQNRGWIYVAGITGLAVTAASGGLAAAATVGVGTLGLLAISGGFAAGTFATINNEELAKSYTIAETRVATALNNAGAMLPKDSRHGNQTLCGEALTHLRSGILVAWTKLEEARTNNALGALDRAKEENKKIVAIAKEIMAEQAAMVTATPAAVTIDATQDRTVTVTLKGGTPPYRVVDRPSNVSAGDPVAGKPDTFTVVVKKDAAEGDVVFFDKAVTPGIGSVAIRRAPIAGNPSSVTIDPAKTSPELILTGGKPPYKVKTEPVGVTVAPRQSGSDNKFTVTVDPAKAVPGSVVVFDDSYDPPQSIGVPLVPKKAE